MQGDPHAFPNAPKPKKSSIRADADRFSDWGCDQKEAQGFLALPLGPQVTCGQHAPDESADLSQQLLSQAGSEARRPTAGPTAAGLLWGPVQHGDVGCQPRGTDAALGVPGRATIWVSLLQCLAFRASYG